MRIEHEDYSGKGRVFSGSELLAHVAYSVHIRQPVDEGRYLDESGSYRIPGLKNIDGRISCDSAQLQRMLTIKELTPHMEGGEKLDFELLDSSGRINARSDIY